MSISLIIILLFTVSLVDLSSLSVKIKTLLSLNNKIRIKHLFNESLNACIFIHLLIRFIT